MKDDIIYLVLLGSCIGFGQFYRKFQDQEQKKWIGTAFGFLVVLSVSGFHMLHLLFCYLVTSLIIIYINRRKCHIASFVFMFGYLFFFRSVTYLGWEAPPGHTNMIQMILTLKLVGLAFEVNAAYTKSKAIGQAKKDEDATAGGKPLDTVTDNEKALLKLDMLDILHYSFNYVGILTGPYFTYKTFRDAITLPFSIRADCIGATLEKLKVIPLYAGLFLLVSFIWPLDYATSTEFYEERSLFYRLMYVWPTFFIFRMRIYTGILLSECVCTMAGFGAYPKACQSKSGHGPSKDCSPMISNSEEHEYDFETVRNIDVVSTETCWTFRETMKYWNMCVQYWMAMYVYKRFPSKTYRTLATLAVSAIWHGVHAGYYFCICAAPFYLPIEDLYVKLFIKDATGTKLKVLNWICWVAKFFAFSYMGIAFLLLSIEKIWFYYGSVYHIAYIFWIVTYVVGVFIAQIKKRNARRTEKLQQSAAQ
ncbi:lysophospholipid acyltransferase 7 [Toxorhynchites rutilus septentrionalis]|uniref:lysophospholipid acyltransferase 7 n=1 Tax=Toxorhynchites rutilus septentrionalis TaxID=329112 RepID=UPI00247846D0|nr:lysophospholipid acyltransferase 7 [Toxorhynchites rutilus septentrionalis]